MTAATDSVEPDEMFDHEGPVARWGQCVVPAGTPIDLIPSVYASHGEIETGDYRFDLDQAEQYAARIVEAVRWQRARDAEQRAADLNAMARGNASTHTWGTRDNRDTGTIECTQCRTLVYSDEYLMAGAVPPCGDRCPLSWHAIASNLSGTPGAAACFHCKTVYPATAGTREGVTTP